MTTGWEENGPKACDVVRDSIESWQQEKINFERSMTDFQRALREHVNGDSSRLVEILRSRPISTNEQEELADELEFPELPKKSGRPPDEAMRWLANTASSIYRSWKARNKGEGVKDRGFADEMKARSCFYAIELAGPWNEGEEPDVEAVKLLLSRPRNRWKLFAY